jgi:hypothetical protein
MMSGAVFCTAPAHADGFGWYAWLFDYDEFLREFRGGELGRAFKPTDTRDTLPEFRGVMEFSAFAVLGLMEESDKVRLERPRLHDDELLWAQAMQEFGEELQRRNPRSPGRFLATGRQFRGLDDMPACKESAWIAGACGSTVMYTPAEVSVLFFEVNELVAKPAKWTDPQMQHELLRLRNLLQEAALLKRAVFFYGHD